MQDTGIKTKVISEICDIAKRNSIDKVILQEAEASCCCAALLHSTLLFRAI